MTKSQKEAHDRAEATFKRKELQAQEGRKAMAEYEAAGRAIREKTARLKDLRLAKEAADLKAGITKAPAPKPATTKIAGTKAVGAKPPATTSAGTKTTGKKAAGKKTTAGG